MSYETFHDISYAQGQYNMDGDPSRIIAMKMSGCYYGSKAPYYDVQAARNYNNAVRLGKVPILYHFAGGGDPVTEADFFVGACSPLADGDILALDYELTSSMSPPSNPSAWCLAFVERVKERTGKYPLFYTYYALLKQFGFQEVLQRCGLWIAHYGVSPDADIPNCPPYIIHQFIGSPLDTDALFISLDVLKQYGFQSAQPQPAPTTPPPTPAPDPQPEPEPAPAPAPTPEPIPAPPAPPEPAPNALPGPTTVSQDQSQPSKTLFDILKGLFDSIIKWLTSFKKG